MNNSLFSLLKKSSPFKKADLIVYILTVIIVAVAFICVFIAKPQSSSGFTVTVCNQEILAYDFDSGSYTSTECDDVRIIVDESGKDNVTFTIKSGKNFENVNVLSVNANKKSVKITDANCPHGDCLNFTPINKNGDNTFIYCASHDLMITAISASGYVPPISG